MHRFDAQTVGVQRPLLLRGGLEIKMTAGQQNGTGAKTELNDEKIEKNEILSNREKSQRSPEQSLDNKGVQIDEYKDIPTNRRPMKPDANAKSESTDKPDKQVDRPGFDLGGTLGDNSAGKGLGLGTDANGRPEGLAATKVNDP